MRWPEDRDAFIEACRGNWERRALGWAGAVFADNPVAIERLRRMSPREAVEQWLSLDVESDYRQRFGHDMHRSDRDPIAREFAQAAIDRYNRGDRA